MLSAVAAHRKLVPVRLRDLVLGQEVTTTILRHRGVVVRTGWVPWDDSTGRTVRLRAVVLRYDGGAERIHVAEMFVLVPADTPHRLFTADERKRRWAEQLPDPDSMGTVGELARVLPC